MTTIDKIFIIVMAAAASFSETWFRLIVTALLAAILVSIWAEGRPTKEINR